ncbi:hypothetical protein TIFTF001_050308 [Ficus carica]|uniref:Glycine-rich protein n=1 Tax=Ficus carica TaxID=3494 RepID=A0AA87Z295_FICCA|nr:hypothetical protein TIFTF001_050308 [Ficus carica]
MDFNMDVGLGFGIGVGVGVKFRDMGRDRVLMSESSFRTGVVGGVFGAGSERGRGQVSG